VHGQARAKLEQERKQKKLGNFLQESGALSVPSWALLSLEGCTLTSEEDSEKNSAHHSLLTKITTSVSVAGPPYWFPDSLKELQKRCQEAVPASLLALDQA
jgi:hypothetical protein